MLYHESLKETTHRHFMDSRAGFFFKHISHNCELAAKEGLLSTELKIKTQSLNEHMIESILFFLKEEDDINTEVEKFDDIYVFDCSWKNANKKRVVMEE